MTMVTIQIESSAAVSSIVMSDGRIIPSNAMQQHTTNDGRLTLSYHRATPAWCDGMSEEELDRFWMERFERATAVAP